jgi:hypothetical protein
VITLGQKMESIEDQVKAMSSKAFKVNAVWN